MAPWHGFSWNTNSGSGTPSSVQILLNSPFESRHALYVAVVATKALTSGGQTAGWTQLFVDNSGTLAHAVYWKVSAGTEDSTTFSVPTSGSGPAARWSCAFLEIAPIGANGVDRNYYLSVAGGAVDVLDHTTSGSGTVTSLSNSSTPGTPQLTKREGEVGLTCFGYDATLTSGPTFSPAIDPSSTATVTAQPTASMVIGWGDTFAVAGNLVASLPTGTDPSCTCTIAPAAHMVGSIITFTASPQTPVVRPRLRWPFLRGPLGQRRQFLPLPPSNRQSFTTQDVGLAAAVSVAITFKTATGEVVAATATNNGATDGSFAFLSGGSWTTVAVPASGVGVALPLPLPNMIQGGDGTWDWDYTQYGWSAGG
jgi:hypothetical protein